jgi:uncharacterized membrane protein YgdD (TMEM256/DUF423 family)
MTATLCLRLAAVSGFLTVALGAFGAHGLRAILDQYDTAAIWDTAVFYHMAHTLALLFLASRPHVNTAAVVCIMAVTNLRWLGAVTPVGGIGFLLGWGLLFFQQP